MQVQNNPELIKNFACLVCRTDHNNEPVQTNGMYSLDPEKIQDIKEAYLIDSGFSTKEQQEQKRYLDKYPKAMNELLEKHEDLYTEYFNDAQDLLDISAHQKELKVLLAKEGIAVKQEYEKYLSQKQSQIETFLDQKKNPREAFEKFATPINEKQRRNSRSKSPDRPAEKKENVVRSGPRM